MAPLHLHIDIRTFRYLMISKAVVDISILDCWSWENALSSTPQLKCAGSARSHHASCSNWRAIKTFTMFSVNCIHRMGRREDRISRYRRKFSRVFHNILSSSMRQGDLVLEKFLEACQWLSLWTSVTALISVFNTLAKFANISNRVVFCGQLSCGWRLQKLLSLTLQSRAWAMVYDVRHVLDAEIRRISSFVFCAGFLIQFIHVDGRW